MGPWPEKVHPSIAKPESKKPGPGAPMGSPKPRFGTTSGQRTDSIRFLNTSIGSRFRLPVKIWPKSDVILIRAIYS